MANFTSIECCRLFPSKWKKIFLYTSARGNASPRKTGFIRVLVSAGSANNVRLGFLWRWKAINFRDNAVGKIDLRCQFDFVPLRFLGSTLGPSYDGRIGEYVCFRVAER